MCEICGGESAEEVCELCLDFAIEVMDTYGFTFFEALEYVRECND